MKKLLGFAVAVLVGAMYLSADAQQYKLRQATSMVGMKTESTIYVKGMRKRTESSGMMGMGGSTVIEQCDLKRNIQLNDKKKLYFIEPFSQGDEEVIDEEKPKAAAPSKPIKVTNEKGGVINMWYNITDTGERKQMYGFTARHVWTSQKIKPSADACTMKDSMLMKTDGWYIDLPQFNCPVQYKPSGGYSRGGPVQVGCTDRFITHRLGKGRLGFPLIQTTTIIMGDKNEIQTSVETLEFTTTKLDSMLFEIPPGYQEAKSSDELQDKMEVGAMMKDVINKAKEANQAVVTEQKKSGMIRIGVFAPTGNDQVQPGELQKHIVSTLTGSKVEAISVSNDEEARKYNCDYTLSTVFTNIKSGLKLGGVLKAIKKADPNVSSSFNIKANLTLTALSDGSVRSQQSVDGKYEGRIDDAAGKALDEGCERVLKDLK